jgi:hypothetical protein
LTVVVGSVVVVGVVVALALGDLAEPQYRKHDCTKELNSTNKQLKKF